MLRKLCFIVLLFSNSILGIAQQENKILHTNKSKIHHIIDDIRKEEWHIAPSLKPDILNLYDLNKKTINVKFISDIDSVEFMVELNTPIDFIILYNNDTAYTRINFTNTFPNNISTADKLFALSMFWSEVKYNFVFYDQLLFDWDSLYQAFIPLVMKTTNDIEYMELMALFSGSLQDGHTNIYFSDFVLPYRDYIPMSVRYFNDTLRIVRVSSNIAETYPLGSKILKINGIDTEEYMSRFVTPYVASRYKPTQQSLSATSLLSAKRLDHELILTYQTPEGEIKTNSPERNGEKYRRPSVGYESQYDSSPINISWMESEQKIALLSLNTFSPFNDYIQKYFEKHKDTLYSADGIIIDLRQNGGGSTDVAIYFLKHIIKDPYFLMYGAEARINNSSKKANGNYIPANEDFYKMRAYETHSSDTIWIEDSIRRFNCPIVVLFSTYTVSAAEDFLIMLYEREDRPLFIGQPSFGSTGGPLVLWDWPIENSFARVCARRILYPYSGKPFIEGVKPDILVEYSFEEFVSGQDKEIECAIEKLKKQIEKSGN